jgi:hypothetical protein
VALALELLSFVSQPLLLLSHPLRLRPAIITAGSQLYTQPSPSSPHHHQRLIKVAMTMAHLSTQRWEADTLNLFAARDKHEKNFTNMVESCNVSLRTKQAFPPPPIHDFSDMHP